MKSIKAVGGIIVLLLVLNYTVSQGTIINFYDDGTIQDGNSLGNVYTWNYAVVDMTGGSIQSLDTLNFSTVNLYAGNITESAYIWNESTLNMYGCNIGWSLEVSDSGTVNLHGGLIADYLYATDSSIVNIHGYGFNYDSDAGGFRLCIRA